MNEFCLESMLFVSPTKSAWVHKSHDWLYIELYYQVYNIFNKNDIKIDTKK